MSAHSDVFAELAEPARLGRLLTRIENDPAERRRVLAQLPTPDSPAHRIGITGSPGVGKSTLIGRLVPLIGGKPAILAVDPSSEQSGGAVLGDRYRWNELAGHGVFMRSLASRGSLGGVSAAAGAALRVLEAAGYGPLLVETVGVGQTGFEVTALVDTVVVLLSPESGDALQLLKAGLIETGDIFVVNKADRPGADALITELRAALESAEQSNRWQPPVLSTVAETGEGVPELASAIEAHWQYLCALAPEDPQRVRKVKAEISYEVRSAVAEAVQQSLDEVLSANPGVIDNLETREAVVRVVLTALTERLRG
jgi:LAO/AO transport system kinase